MVWLIALGLQRHCFRRFRNADAVSGSLPRHPQFAQTVQVGTLEAGLVDRKFRLPVPEALQRLPQTTQSGGPLASNRLEVNFDRDDLFLTSFILGPEVPGVLQ